MCSIDENHYDMNQHREGITSSKTAAGSLDLLRKDDSYFPHSIDICHMVKILCAPQEYFKWDIFLTFTCNTIKYFGIKPIHEWLDDNKWKMNFPNWDTYSFFQQQEIEESLHQSAPGLFLRLWEEFSAIFIAYLRNSPSIPFLNMLAVFACKEYQHYLGNLSHIHLLGKLRQLSEQSRT